MKRKFAWFLALAVIAGTLFVLLVPKKIVRNLYYYVKGSDLKERKTEPVVAFFDRNKEGLISNSDSFEYVNFTISDSEIKSSGMPGGGNSPLFVTVDMWNKYISENPLESIVNGKYDQVIRTLCDSLANAGRPVFIRWNPEMEVNADKYPWQLQSPVLYNKAFYYFASMCRSLSPEAKIVWSAAGYPGVLDYYPQEDFVDYLSVTLGSSSEKSKDTYPDYKSVSDEIIHKVHRLRFIDKPVFILQSDNTKTGSLNMAVAEAAEYLKQNRMEIFSTINAGDSAVTHERDSIQFGAYDPEKKFSDIEQISTEHIFIDWHHIQDGSYEKQIKEIAGRGHDIIVTLEPWREENARPDTNVLLSVVGGRYDDYLERLFNTLAKTDRTVYLRWIHEMEIPVTRYPWQSQLPVNYIKAFRHFASFRKPGNTNIKLVWGPAGDRGLQDFWPGGDVVDYISIAIYGLPDKNITDHKQQESFKTIFTRKNNRMRFFNKPVFITEFGIKGPDDFQRQWLLAAAETIKSNPQVKGVCYFNMVDTPKAWGDIAAPVWKISSETYRAFINAFNTDSPDLTASKK